MKVKVSDVIARFFEAKGIRHAFGIIGAGNAHLFDSVATRGFTHIVCVHHEQAGCMAMQTYYRTSGQVAVSLLTTGAGSTNGITGVVSAWMDSIPGLIISGNENSKFTTEENPLRIWGVQGYDSAAMVSKVVKYASRVLDPRRVLAELEHAYAIAVSGRPGPVWLDIPMNIQSALIEESEFEAPVAEPAVRASGAQKSLPLPEALQRIVSLLEGSERPVLWLGHGIRLAQAEGVVKPLVNALGIPTLVSWAGIDLIDLNHPLVYGRAGLYGQRCANFVLQNCDLLVTIGTRLAIPQVGYDITEFARGAKVVVVDIDAAELGKYADRYELTVCEDARTFCSALMESIASSGRAAKSTAAPRQASIKQCDDYRKRYPWVGPEHADRDGFINSYAFMERLNKHLKPDQVVVTDMGTALLAGHQVLKITPPQRLMTSTGLGEMGYGLPGAIGASFARNRGEVLCLNCDGEMMNLQELQTVVHHELPIKLIIFNNDGYLMIKHTQKALFKGRYAGTDARSGVTCPDFSRVAQAFDIPSFQIRTWKDFDQIIPQFQALPRSAVCEVFTHPEQPLVPKLSLAVQEDGTLVSPPLEDLSPLLPRDELARNMAVVGMHPKSKHLKP